MGQIVCGDVLVGLNGLPDRFADVIIADPPYNIGKDFGAGVDDSRNIRDYVDWCREWIDQSYRVMKPTATMYIYGFSEILAYVSVIMPDCLLNHRWLVWHYTNKAVPSLKFWQRSHESILCCWKADRIFNLDDVREEYTDTFLKNAAGRVRKGTKGRYSHGGKETIYNANDKGALPRDVIKVGALAGGAGASERWFLCRSCNDVFKDVEGHEGHEIIRHPTQKPYELTRRLLLAAKPASGGMLVVPFVGSGSECAVAADLGMDYAGFELNEDYVKLAEGFLANRVKCAI